MKKFISLSIALLAFIQLTIAQSKADNPDGIIGVYWSPKKDAKIEIFKRGNKYFGRSIWSSTPRTDNKNPNASLRNRTLVGVELFTNFTYDDGKYVDGQIYDPESGKTYDCKISFAGKNLKVRGYIGVSLFGRTEIFETITQ